MLTTHIYTDGACSSSDNTGGWAVVIETNQTQPYYVRNMSDYKTKITNTYLSYMGSDRDTTNNRMELTALLVALKFISDQQTNYDFIIYTDSAYIANCFNQKWYVNWRKNNWRGSNRKPIANQDLWEQILDYYDHLQLRTTIQHVRGHGNCVGNALADRLAVEERLELRKQLNKQKDENN